MSSFSKKMDYLTISLCEIKVQDPRSKNQIKKSKEEKIKNKPLPA